MVGGQVGDIEAEGQPAALEQVQWIHDRKTGALIAASLEIGAIAAGAPSAAIAAIRDYGELLGRAFQIADDCLDVTGDEATLGKRPGQDVALRKATYPAVLGLAASQREAARLSGDAAALAPRICAAGRANMVGVLDDHIRLLEDTAFSITARVS
jgi:geranylgeranyl pyrophosphate synthase